MAFPVSKTFVVEIMARVKPKITFMAMVVALGCMLLVEKEHGFWQVVISLFGIGLLVCGCSAFKMYTERDYDGLMERTKNRPFPTKRLKPFLAYL